MFQTTNQHNFVLHVKHIQASTVFAWVWRTTTKLQHIQLWRSKPKVVVISYIYHNIIYRLHIYIYIYTYGCRLGYIMLYIVIYVGYIWIINQGSWVGCTSCRHLGAPHHRYIPSHEPKLGSFNGSFLLSKIPWPSRDMQRFFFRHAIASWKTTSYCTIQKKKE